MTHRSRKQGRLIDHTGQRFGRLAVTGRAPNQGETARWNCTCDCGKEKRILGSHLRAGRIVSCGCWASDKARERATHGKSKTRTYVAWRSMLNRCYWTKENRYERYGGRGIVVCDRWKTSFANFLSDMGEAPAGLTLDRKDNDGNYEPGNCRWASRVTQANNKRNNVMLDYQGESISMKQLSRKCGVKYQTLFWRIRVAKWPLVRAVQP